MLSVRLSERSRKHLVDCFLVYVRLFVCVKHIYMPLEVYIHICISVQSWILQICKCVYMHAHACVHTRHGNFSIKGEYLSREGWPLMSMKAQTSPDHECLKGNCVPSCLELRHPVMRMTEKKEQVLCADLPVNGRYNAPGSWRGMRERSSGAVLGEGEEEGKGRGGGHR